MLPDLLEDLIAFAYTIQSTSEKVCPDCGNNLKENDDGEPYCPQCDE